MSFDHLLGQVKITVRRLPDGIVEITLVDYKGSQKSYSVDVYVPEGVDEQVEVALEWLTPYIFEKLLELVKR